jgi:acetyl-CoA acetyltransferase
MKTPITVEDVLNSRMIAYPFRILQCCLVTDGGGALILTSADRAKDFPTKPVYILGTGESVETPMVSQMQTFDSSRAFKVAGPLAFRRRALRTGMSTISWSTTLSRICRCMASAISASCRMKK